MSRETEIREGYDLMIREALVAGDKETAEILRKGKDEDLEKERQRSLQAQKELAMFGTSVADIEGAVKAADWRHEADPARPWNGVKALAMGILSDAQELMAAGHENRARQYINQAKYIIDKHL
jgi:hypothetical protein